MTGEDDLAEVRLAYSPATGVDGCRITLVASQGADKIRVWKSPTKDVGDEIAVSGNGATYLIGTDTIPSTVYAEGILAGVATLDLVFRQADDTEICRDKVAFTVRDTTGPYFFDFLAQPPAAKQGDAVVLTFKASEDLAANPTVTVNGHTASYVSSTGRSYTYSYTVQSTSIDPPGPAVIVASGADTCNPANEGSSTNTTALFIYADGACNIVEYTYDKCGKRKTVCDSRGVTVLFHDEADRLSSVRDPDGESIAYEYDPNGRRIGMVDHDSGETVYAYYDNGWIHTITDRDQGTTTFEFHPDGMVQKITYPNGTYTEYGFDTSGGLSSLANKRADGVVLAGFGFYYETADDNGASWPGQILVTRVVEQVRLPDPNPDNLMASATIYYAYDDQYRVVRERRVGDLPFDRNYGYDAVGNRSSLVTKDSQGNVTSTTSYTHDEVGRILTKGSVTFDYDFDDLTMTRTEGANVRRYSFSAEGNLIRVEDGQDVVAQFTYDGLGRRTSFTGIDGITRGARFDLDSIIAEESIEGTTHYLLDELGLLYGASDSETRRYYHFNDMGDTCALTTAGPTVTEQWAATYDVFGVISVIDAQSLNALNAARALHSSRILAFSDPDQPFQGGGQAGDYTPPGTGPLRMRGSGGSGHIDYDDSLVWICFHGPRPPAPSCPPGMVCLAGADQCLEAQPVPDNRDWLLKTSDFFAGWGDTLTLGGTKHARRWVGQLAGVGDANEVVDTTSGWYKAGEWTGIAHTTAFGLAGGIRAAGVKGAGREFSHFWPKRWGGPRSIWNGNWVTPRRHYLHDPFRYPPGWEMLGPRLPVVIQQLDRIPNVYKGIAGGVLWGWGGRKLNRWTWDYWTW